MNDNTPQAWSRVVVLSGHPQLTPHLRGNWSQVWLGVSLLHSMQKLEPRK